MDIDQLLSSSDPVDRAALSTAGIEGALDEARLWLFGVARILLMKGADRRKSGTALVERLAADLRTGGQPNERVDDGRGHGSGESSSLLRPGLRLGGLRA